MSEMKKMIQIGAQILEKEMIDCIFHHSEAVLHNVESLRAIAQQEYRDFNKKLRDNPHEAVMLAKGFSNAISIVGSRGSGKTSVIMALQQMLCNGDAADSCGTKLTARNIMMPMLVPQDFAPGKPLLSWIITQLTQKAEEVQREIQAKTYGFWYDDLWKEWQTDENQKRHMSPLEACVEELTAAFELRTIDGHAAQSVGGEYIYDYMDSVKRDADLVETMLKLTSMIMEYYRCRMRGEDQACGMAKERVSEPMLFYFIDDLDLAPERSNEVLNLILRYLQHPNVIVLCGWNQELYQNHLNTELLRNQGVLESRLLETSFTYDDVFQQRYRKHISALESSRRLAIDNLKKAFPISQRYEIRGLSIEERACFPYAPGLKCTEKGEKRLSLFKLIESTLLRCASRDEETEKVEFLYGMNGEPLHIYTRIFDNKGRGLINVYKAFELLSGMMQENCDEEKDVTYEVLQLLNTLLNSNTHFAPFYKGIRDLLQIKRVVLSKEKIKPDYYFNYQGAWDLLEKYKEEKKKGEEKENRAYFDYPAENILEQKYVYFPELIIEVLLLMNFMENLLHFITQAGGSEHGGRIFSKVLNQCHKPIIFSKTSENVVEQVAVAAEIETLSFYPETDDFALNVALLQAYEKCGLKEINYQLTGFHCYEKVLRSVFSLLLHQNKVCIKAARRMYEGNALWLRNVLRIFSAVQPTNQNVSRLAIYTCLKKTGIGLEEETNRLTAVNLPQKNVFVKQEVQKTITDDDLEDIVFCLRLLEKTRGLFSGCCSRMRRERGIIGEFVQNGLKQAVVFVELVEMRRKKLEKMKKEPNSASIKSYRLNLERPKTSEAGGDDKKLSVEEAVELMGIADMYMENEKEILLECLKKGILQAVNINCWKHEGDWEFQYKYLQHAASCIPRYINLWNLLQGVWGVEEVRAVDKLSEIFERYYLNEPKEMVEDIQRIGPTLQTTGRERYNNIIRQLKKWLYNKTDRFSNFEQSVIKKNVDTLAQAPSKIRRALDVENAIYDVLLNVGRGIAQQCGIVAQMLFAKGKRITVWPISRHLDRQFAEWGSAMDQYTRPVQNVSFSILDYNDLDIEIQKILAGQ